MRQKQTQLTSFRLQLAQTRLCGTRKTKSQQHPRDSEQDWRSCVHRCLKKAHGSQGGAANSIRPRAANLGIKVSSSPAVQNGETEAHRGSGYSTRRLESTERSYGSDPRHEAEMSQRCELMMMMPTWHDSLDGKIEMSQHCELTTRMMVRRDSLCGKIEMSPQCVSTKRASR